MPDEWNKRPECMTGTRAAYSIDGAGALLLWVPDFEDKHVARDRLGVRHCIEMVGGVPQARCHYMFYESGIIHRGVPNCIMCMGKAT